VEDDLKNRYAIEMQKSTTYNLPRRRDEFMKLYMEDITIAEVILSQVDF